MSKDRNEPLAAESGAQRDASTFERLLRGAARTPEVRPSGIAPGTLLIGGRFLVGRRLGEGGMGVVFEAEDRTTGVRVALKTLSRVDAAGIYRFKKEFRLLADVVHENLVGLHELFAQDGHWFFTMELIDGVPFVEHARHDPATAFDETLTPRAGDLAPVEAPAGLPVDRATGTLRERALRGALRQLCAGVTALHRAGRVHCDLKPSNVLVARSGRVTILDFGLARDVTSTQEQTVGGFAGTPSYMAPEQAHGLAATPATDWYAVGVMLYEALTGTLPFRGSLGEIFMAKQSTLPEPPSASVPDLPSDLESLCLKLLHPDPAQRTNGEAALEHIDATPDGARGIVSGAIQSDGPAPDSAPFVGRRSELGVLREAFGQRAAGEAAIVYASGPSGIGKTAVVEHFLKQVDELADAVVLRGRCYERESIAYKAIDPVVDALSRYLAALPDVATAALTPRDIRALVRMFPVLDRIPIVTSASGRGAPTDPHELRRRAFAAFRDLLTRLSDTRRVVIAIDDVQWGDIDSARLIADLMVPPDPPALLLVLVSRSEEAAGSECLEYLLERDRDGALPPSRHLQIGPLAGADTGELALSMLGPNVPDRDGVADAIAAESGGHPYLIAELSRRARIGAGLSSQLGSLGGVTVDEALRARIATLDRRARAVLDALSVAARPVDSSVLAAVCGNGTDFRASVDTLRSMHLLRGAAGRKPGTLATYHDRVREAVASALDDDATARWHERFARVLDGREGANPENVVVHLLGAGRPDEAAARAERAAEHAAETLAFERAAALYRLALQSGSLDEERRRELTVRRAEALINANRAADAARAFLQAAEGASPDAGADLTRRAGLELVCSGQIDEGMQVLERAFRALELELPRPGPETYQRIAELEARFRKRGAHFELREEDEIDPLELRRIDTLTSAALALAAVEDVQAAVLQLDALLRALDAGEPERIARTLAARAVFAAALAPRESTPEELMAAAEHAIADQDDVVRDRAMTGWAAIKGYRGEWRTGVPFYRRAEEIWRAAGHGRSRSLAVYRRNLSLALYSSGYIKEMGRLLPGWVRDADERNDVYLRAALRADQALWLLARDDPAAAARCLEDASKIWVRSAFDQVSMSVAICRRVVAVYTGAAPEWQEDLAWWREVSSSPVMTVPVLRATVFSLFGGLFLAHAARPPARDEALRLASDCADGIETLPIPSTKPWVPAIRAALAHAQGDGERTVALLREAIGGFHGPEGNHVYGACCRRRLGRIIGGSEGRALIAEADATMTAEGIRSPERWEATFVPGFD